jgi:hypothetical protein
MQRNDAGRLKCVGTVAVSEDIRVESAPDVTFLLNITRHGL